MTDLHDRPNYPHGALLIPLTDDEQAEYLQSRNRYERDSLSAAHHGPRDVSHVPYWQVRKRFGPVALELRCERGLLDNENRLWRCGEVRRVSSGKYSWADSADRPKLPRNARKSVILAALSRLGGSGTVGELALAAGLDRNVVAGCLQGGQRARGAYVSRSPGRELTATGSAHIWTLTDRGRLWLRWAAARGLVQAPRKVAPNE